MSQVMIPAALAALILALTRPALGQAPAAGDSLRLKVDGMVCSLFAYGIERRLKKIEHVEASEWSWTADSWCSRSDPARWSATRCSLPKCAGRGLRCAA